MPFLVAEPRSFPPLQRTNSKPMMAADNRKPQYNAANCPCVPGCACCEGDRDDLKNDSSRQECDSARRIDRASEHDSNETARVDIRENYIKIEEDQLAIHIPLRELCPETHPFLNTRFGPSHEPFITATVGVRHVQRLIFNIAIERHESRPASPSSLANEPADSGQNSLASSIVLSTRSGSPAYLLQGLGIQFPWTERAGVSSLFLGAPLPLTPQLQSGVGVEPGPYAQKLTDEDLKDDA